MLVLLRRDVSSTRVLLRSDDPAGAPFAGAAARPNADQWGLVEELCAATWANEINRLYATTLSVTVGDERFGLFVGFLDDDADDAPLPPLFEWRDLRDAAKALSAPWGELLENVRAGFIARSPDEALRIR